MAQSDNTSATPNSLPPPLAPASHEGARLFSFDPGRVHLGFALMRIEPGTLLTLDCVRTVNVQALAYRSPTWPYDSTLDTAQAFWSVLNAIRDEFQIGPADVCVIEKQLRSSFNHKNLMVEAWISMWAIGTFGRKRVCVIQPGRKFDSRAALSAATTLVRLGRRVPAGPKAKAKHVFQLLWPCSDAESPDPMDAALQAQYVYERYYLGWPLHEEQAEEWASGAAALAKAPSVRARGKRRRVGR